MKHAIATILIITLAFGTFGCASMSNQEKGAVIGAGAGAAAGAAIGKATGTTAMGAILGAAIGDALGHLNFFMLDDPADGLDLKRKRTLAYLLAEVAARRQVLVTTNDADFSDLFSGGLRVDLENSG